MIERITEEMRNPQTLTLRNCEGQWVKIGMYKLLLAKIGVLEEEREELLRQNAKLRINGNSCEKGNQS